MSDTWTIGELAEHAADALRAHGQPVNGRVRDLPGERLIRWYTTIGLVDPPLSRRGRIARYGRRHLLQLVAVKRMQATGMSIADIQATLAGATDAMLEEAAGSGTPRPAGRPAPTVPPPSGPETRFWTRSSGNAARKNTTPVNESSPPGHSGTPMEESDPPGHSSTPADESSPPGHSGMTMDESVLTGRNSTPDGAGTPVRGVRLAGGVTLLLDGAGRTPTKDDVQAVLAAAGPLLAVLDERKLT